MAKGRHDKSRTIHDLVRINHDWKAGKNRACRTRSYPYCTQDRCTLRMVLKIGHEGKHYEGRQVWGVNYENILRFEGTALNRKDRGRQNKVGQGGSEWAVGRLCR